ncbi:helix-turn-helix transcriptional regulator [Serratia fonticola]|uniref:helix-turn-helix transcriptional regulator n=1 Tax=Serratia fonticola TaxID=47917 RepID=UPI0008FEEE42|nr:AlpA family phage regulatory protein [Serratia fonticola]
MSTQAMKILRLPDVVKKIGIARATIYDWINPKSPRFDPTFPRQILLGKKSVGWLESDLDQWLLHRSTAVY